jgi:hypothetical protein
MVNGNIEMTSRNNSNRVSPTNINRRVPEIIEGGGLGGDHAESNLWPCGIILFLWLATYVFEKFFSKQNKKDYVSKNYVVFGIFLFFTLFLGVVPNTSLGGPVLPFVIFFIIWVIQIRVFPTLWKAYKSTKGKTL